MFGSTSRNIRYADLAAPSTPKIFGNGSLVVPVQFAKTAQRPTLVISSIPSNSTTDSVGDGKPSAMNYIEHYDGAIAAQKKECEGGVDGSLFVFLAEGRTLPDWWTGGTTKESSPATVILDLNKCTRHGDCSTTKCKKHPHKENCPEECVKKGDAHTLQSHQYYFSSYDVGENKHYSFQVEHVMTTFGDLITPTYLAGPDRPKTDNAIVLSISIYVKSLKKKFGTQVLAFAIDLPPIIQFD